jgi:hypothetical protein
MFTEVKTVGTDEFWEAMCSFRFVRINMHEGAIGATLYVTVAPPEQVPGYIEAKILSSEDCLKIKTLR